MEIEPRQEPFQESRWAYKKIATYLAIGTLAIGAGVAGTWEYLNHKSGEHIHLKAKHKDEPYIDGQINLLTWNMHDETPAHIQDIKKLQTDYGLDAIMLQEVGKDDLEYLHDEITNSDIVYVQGDPRARIEKSGLGNVIITQQSPHRIRSSVIHGTSTVESAMGFIGGLANDVWGGIADANPSLKNAKDGVQENRGALSENIEVKDGRQNIDITTMTSHISGMKLVHDRQFKTLMKFITKNTKNGTPAFFCGDLNESQSSTIKKFASIGMITALTTKTTKNRSFPKDYCAYNSAGKTSLDTAKVLYKYYTDHYPVLFSITVTKPQELGVH